MNIESFNENINFNDDKVVTKLVLETSFTKEIRILLKNGQVMKEHKAPFPIIVHVLEGEIQFGMQGKSVLLKKGDLITLEGGIAHDLSAQVDSVVRLTLYKQDDVSRVKKVIEKS